MNKMKKRNGGFSIAEVVVALTVIVIVSIVSLSIVTSSIEAKADAVNKTKAQNYAANVLECFKASADIDKFESYVKFAEAELTLQSNLDDEYIYAYESQKSDFKAEIKVKFTDVDRASFEINVKDGSEKDIVSFLYKKGD